MLIHARQLAATKDQKVPTDKSCWKCKYWGNWTGGTFIQDFTCTWSRSMVQERIRNCGLKRTWKRGVSFGKGRAKVLMDEYFKSFKVEHNQLDEMVDEVLRNFKK